MQVYKHKHVTGRINDNPFTWTSSCFHHLGPALRDPGETHTSECLTNTNVDKHLRISNDIPYI